MPVIEHQVRKNLQDGTHALTVHLPNPVNMDNQPKKSRSSTDQPKIAQMIVNLASRHGARQMMTALRPFAEKHGGKNTLVKAPNQPLAKMRQRRPKPCSANAQNLPIGPVLVMREMAAIGRKNQAKRAAGVQVLGVQVPGHPDQGHHGLDRGGTAA